VDPSICSAKPIPHLGGVCNPCLNCETAVAVVLPAKGRCSRHGLGRPIVGGRGLRRPAAPQRIHVAVKFHWQTTLVQNDPLLQKAFSLLLSRKARGRLLQARDTVHSPRADPAHRPGRAADARNLCTRLLPVSPAKVTSGAGHRNRNLRDCRKARASPRCWQTRRARESKVCERTGRF